MKLIIKYFKPFVFMAAVSIALLFCQTITDLFLPRYMSSMVDTGIMRGGITETEPRAMSDEAFDFITSYMTEEGAAAFDAAYTRTTNISSSDASTFPLLKSEGGRVLTETNKAKLAMLGKYYGDAALNLSGRLNLWYVSQPDFDPAKPLDITNRLEPETLYAADLSRTMPADPDAPPIPEQTKFEIGATFTRLFYRELGADLNAIQQRSILGIGTIMIGFTLIVIAVTVLNGFLSAKISTGIGRNLRHDLFAKVQTFSPAEFDKFSTASLITRCTNDVSRVQQVAMMSLRMILQAPLTGIGGVVMALQMNKGMSWIVAVAVVLLCSLQFTLMTKIIPKFQIMQKLQDKINLVARESLTGMMVIRAFGNEKREEARFEEANRNIRNTNQYVQRIQAIQNPTMSFLNGLTSLTVIFFGARAVDMGSMQVGQMMAFMQYVMQVIQAFMMISMMFIMIPQALVSATRLREVLDTNTAIHDPEPGKIKTFKGRARGEVAFKNVSFKYQDAEASVLEDITFTAKAGEMTAFIGSTGSGKSTLINLIPRFYDVSTGTITLDGVDIRDLTLIELRDCLGYVPQKGVLFSGNIETNLSYGKEDATDEEFRTAIRVAQAETFVYADKDGLQTEIAQSGDNVSGGQKQRLSIARALVKNPPVFIFDDSFSALDFKTDAALRKALREHTGGATTLVVAQRISTIMNANQIIVLDAGRIVGKGTHRELLETCEAYREIAESQLSKEELA